MTQPHSDNTTGLLLMIAGAKGAIASTIAVSTAVLRHGGVGGLGGLTTADKFAALGPVDRIQFVGWDTQHRSLAEAVAYHGVLSRDLWQAHTDSLEEMAIRRAPDPSLSLGRQVESIQTDIRAFQSRYPKARAVLVNLLPACCDISQVHRLNSLEQLLAESPQGPPDVAYAIAAVLCNVPVINFTPNTIEIKAIIERAASNGIPLAGRDGKTGQTYFKVVLASAFKARALEVNGWYSLNILGNEDGRNLMDPDRACGKLQNKTNLLDDILGYGVGRKYGEPSHKVHIDYYPPRGDAKEAWDVIDFSGILGLPMSLRLNLQGRDSILAAPMVIDLARWVTALHMAGIGGPVGELGFFFKKPVGENPGLTFQDQLLALDRLEQRIGAALDGPGISG
jgi:myo-inositol-1-phosphate synthase